MGYRRQRKVFRLRFEDEPGLEVHVYSVPLGTITGMLDMVKDLSAEGVRRGGAEVLAQVDELFGVFVGALKEWNLELEDGTPVPATVDGLKTQDLDFCLELVLAWMEAVGDVSAPLKRNRR